MKSEGIEDSPISILFS